MAIGKVNVGGGLNIKGIIEEYKVSSGGNISVGDFVNTINGIGTSYALIAADLIYEVVAVALDDSRVFIAWTYNSTKYLKGIVCTITDKKITTGSGLVIKNATVESLSVTKLTNNKVYIMYVASEKNVARVLNLNGNDIISLGNETTIDDTKALETFSLALDVSRVLVLARYSNGKIQSRVCVVSGNSITPHDIKLLAVIATSDLSVKRLSATLLGTNRVYIAYDNQINIMGMLLTITNYVINTPVSVTLTTGFFTNISTVKLTDSKVATTAISNETLYIIISDIDSEGYITSKVTKLDTPVKDTSFVLLDASKILVVFAKSNSLNGMLVVVNTDNSIEILDKVVIKSGIMDTITAVTPSLDVIHISYRYMIGSSQLSACIVCKMTDNTIGLLVKKATTKDEINGVAKQSGTSGQTIKVITL